MIEREREQRNLSELIKIASASVGTAVVLAGAIGTAYVVRDNVIQLTAKVSALEADYRIHVAQSIKWQAEFQAVQAEHSEVRRTLAQVRDALIEMQADLRAMRERFDARDRSERRRLNDE